MAVATTLLDLSGCGRYDIEAAGTERYQRELRALAKSGVRADWRAEVRVFLMPDVSEPGAIRVVDGHERTVAYLPGLLAPAYRRCFDRMRTHGYTLGMCHAVVTGGEVSPLPYVLRLDLKPPDTVLPDEPRKMDEVTEPRRPGTWSQDARIR